MLDFTINKNQNLHFNKNASHEVVVKKNPQTKKKVASKADIKKSKKATKTKTEPLAAKIQCTECSNCYSRVAYLKVHIQNVHENKKRFSCNFCAYRTVYKQHFTLHLATHVDVQLTGETMTSNDKKLLVSTKKESDVCLTCQLCSKDFESVTKLAKHYLRKHQAVRKFECDHCGWRSTRKENLASHITCKHLIDTFYDVYNKERRFKCTFKNCRKRFKILSVLRQHITRTHSGTKITFSKLQMLTNNFFLLGIRHTCFWCQKSWCKKFDLLKHQKTCLPIKTETEK